MAEEPIFVEYLASQRTQSFRATSADALQRFPETYDTVWDPANLPPPAPPGGLAPNGAPAGGVQLATITLQALPGSGGRKYQFLAATPPVVLPPPLLVASLDRVIPATWGDQALVPGAYQPVLTNAAGEVVPYDGTSWVLDGVNRFLEFPLAVPPDFLTGPGPPTLLFYRYTGAVAGGGSVVGAANEGSGARVFDLANSTAALLAFRTLAEGPGITLAEDAPAPGEISVGLTPPPSTVGPYVNGATGNDVTGDGTPGLPYLTLERAFRDIRESGWDDTAFVNVQASSPPLAMPTGLIALNSGSLGSQAHLVVIRGAPRAPVLADTVAAVVADPVSQLMTITGASGPYPLGYVGLLIRFTSGALSTYSIPNIAPPVVVQAEAFVGRVTGGGDLLIAFTGSGVLPAPGDSFVLEDLTTQIFTDTASIIESPSRIVFRDIEFTTAPALFSIFGFKNFDIEFFAVRVRPGAAGAMVIGSINGTLTASTQNANATTVPSTAGMATLPGGVLLRSSDSETVDVLANCVFLGTCVYGSGFIVLSSFASALAPDSTIFSASETRSTIGNCWFDCDGGVSVAGTPAIVESTAGASLLVASFRSASGSDSIVLRAGEGGRIQLGVSAIAGCGTAFFAGNGGALSLTDPAVVSGVGALAGSMAVVQLEPGGSLVSVGSLAVSALASGATAVRVVAGAMTLAIGLSASAVDADCVVMDEGAILRCLFGGPFSLEASHSAPAPGVAAFRFRGGARVSASGLDVPGANSEFGLVVEEGATLQITGGVSVSSTGAGVAISVLGGQMSSGGAVVVTLGAGTGVLVTNGSLACGPLTCDGCLGPGVSLSDARLRVAGDLGASSCGLVGLSADGGSTVGVSGTLTAQDSPTGVLISNSALFAGNITADSPLAVGGSVGVDLAGGSVVVGGSLTASTIGGPRLVGLRADKSSIVAALIVSSGCFGDNVSMSHSVAKCTLTADGSLGGVGVYAHFSRISMDIGSSLSGNAGDGALAVDESTLVIVANIGGNGGAGVAVARGSTLVFVGSAAGNAGPGVIATAHSSAVVSGPGSAFTGNGGLAALVASGASALSISETEISSNIGAGVLITRGSTGDFESLLIDGNGLSGIVIERASRASVEADVSTGVPNTGFGLEVRRGATVSAEATPSLTGAAGDVGLGSLGATTWATLAGQLPATSTDLFALTTEQCGVILA